MKKIRNLLFILAIMFICSITVKADTKKLVIDSSGSLAPETTLGQDFRYFSDTKELHLLLGDLNYVDIDIDYAGITIYVDEDSHIVNLNCSKDIKIVADKKLYIGLINGSGTRSGRTVTIENSNDVTINSIYKTDVVNITNSNIVFERGIFKNDDTDGFTEVNISDSNLTRGNTGSSNNTVEFQTKSFKLNNSTLDNKGYNIETYGNDSYIKDSTINTDNLSVIATIYSNPGLDLGEFLIENSSVSSFESTNLSAETIVKDSILNLKVLENNDISTKKITNSLLNLDTNGSVFNLRIDEVNNSEITGTKGITIRKNRDLTPTFQEIFNANNMIALNENDEELEYDCEANFCSFYDKEGNNLKFVRLANAVNVTYKVVNGTWSDGKNEDITLRTYYGKILTENNIPKDMIANKGYENGSWDSAALNSKITEDVTYTYTFNANSEVINEILDTLTTDEIEKIINDNKDESEDKIIFTKDGVGITLKELKNYIDNKVENPKTGYIIGFVKILAIVGAIFGLVYFGKKLRFNN